MEVAVIVALILVLIVSIIQAVWRLRADAERVSVAQNVAAVREALSNEILVRVIRSQQPLDRIVAELQYTNPFHLLEQPPPNYLGELSAADPAGIDGYQWYFDTERALLVYRIGNPERFRTPLAGPARIRFQLRPQFQDRNGDGRFDPAIDEADSLVFDSMEPYRWIHPEGE